MIWSSENLIEYEGSKRKLKRRPVKIIFTSFVCLIAFIQFCRAPDDSDLSKVYRPFIHHGNIRGVAISPKGIVLQTEAQANSKTKGSRGDGISRPKDIVYSGKQVLERTGIDGLLTPLPSGTNFIGKLLTLIDTNVPGQVAKVTLPYGARHPKGGSLPKNSTLFGTTASDGESEKVFIRFHKVIFPDGKEYRIDAQALNSADFLPGIVGIKHSNTDLKMASSMGLTMISAASDVLTQRSGFQAMGGIPMGIDSPDATIKNAILQGVSQVSRLEAQKQAQDLGNVPDYVTVPEGADLIINLLSPFNGEAI